MIGPLLNYLYEGFYFNDNHDPVYELPDGRVCWFYVKDCTRIIRAFGDNMDDTTKSMILFHQVLTASLLEVLDFDALRTLCHARKIEMDTESWLGAMFLWRENMEEEDNIVFTLYFRQLWEENKDKYDEEDVINCILMATQGRMSVQNGHLLCLA